MRNNRWEIFLSQLEQIIEQEYWKSDLTKVKKVAIEHLEQCQALYFELHEKEKVRHEILIQHSYEMFKKSYSEFNAPTFNNPVFDEKVKDLSYRYINELSDNLNELKAETIRLLDIRLKMQIRYSLTIIGLECNPKLSATNITKLQG